MAHEITVYSEFRSQLAELKALNGSVVFDYQDPAGNKEARSHIYKLRKTKSAVDAARKAEKAASLEYGRQVDAQAKDIIGEIETMISVHQTPLDEIEAREKERQSAHEARIATMRELATESNEHFTAAQLIQRLDELSSYKLGAHWQEYEIEAARVKEAGAESLGLQIERQQKREADQADLEKLRREQEARDQAERDAIIAKEAEERATRAAEERAQREREEADRKAQAERDAAERREQGLRFAAEKAEREKAEAELRAQRALQEARERAEREAKAEAEKETAEAEKREANKRHAAQVHGAAVNAMVASGIAEDCAKAVVALIAQRKIPNIKVTY